VLKQRRHDLELTQRELAAKIGVKPAHIAYLELDRRRPSLTLLGQIADVLKLERESLFALSHPEAETFMGARRKSTAARTKDRVWRDFKSDRHTLAHHDVTGEELKLLSSVSLLGKVTAPRNFLFILNSIREAAEEEE
jgi:transcriptional regulator with XRE-family HTH domain